LLKSKYFSALNKFSRMSHCCLQIAFFAFVEEKSGDFFFFVARMRKTANKNHFIHSLLSANEMLMRKNIFFSFCCYLSTFSLQSSVFTLTNLFTAFLTDFSLQNNKILWCILWRGHKSYRSRVEIVQIKSLQFSLQIL
jgi:hypothetical protein